MLRSPPPSQRVASRPGGYAKLPMMDSPNLPRPPVRLSPDEVPPELADSPLIKFWQTMTAQEEEVLEHLAELDRREQIRENERAQSELTAGEEPAAHP